MVTHLMIYGAIGTSWSLTKDVYGTINKIRKDASTYKIDLEEFEINFQDNQQKLDAFTTGFTEIKDKLHPDHQQFVERISQHLNDKLEEAKLKMLKHYSLLEWLWVKEDMQAAVKALSEWANCFEARFVLLPKDLKKTFEDKFISPEHKALRDGPLAELYRHIDLKATQLRIDKEDPEIIMSTMTDEIPDIEEHDVRRYQYHKDIIKIPEHIQADQVELKKFKLEVARLVAVLKAANPSLTYLPKAVSWFQQPLSRESAPQAFGIAYRLGDHVEIQRSLKNTITLNPQQQSVPPSQIPQHTLTDRMKLALEFVSAMAYIRGLNWVHKAIRPSNIILCYDLNDGDAPHNLGHVKLVGFNVARRGTGEVKSSSQDNERFWYEQIYCHPQRQTINKMVEDTQIAQEKAAEEASTKATSSHNLTVTAAVSPAAARLPYYTYMHDIYSVGVVLLEIGLWQDLTIEPGNKVLREAEPEQRKRILIGLAKDKLPPRVGDRYASVVRSCLEVDKDGPEIKDVLSKLAQIQV